jgi:hypothetical protein
MALAVLFSTQCSCNPSRRLVLAMLPLPVAVLWLFAVLL